MFYIYGLIWNHVCTVDLGLQAEIDSKLFCFVGRIRTSESLSDALGGLNWRGPGDSVYYLVHVCLNCRVRVGVLNPQLFTRSSKPTVKLCARGQLHTYDLQYNFGRYRQPKKNPTPS